MRRKPALYVLTNILQDFLAVLLKYLFKEQNKLSLRDFVSPSDAFHKINMVTDQIRPLCTKLYPKQKIDCEFPIEYRSTLLQVLKSLDIEEDQHSHADEESKKVSLPKKSI